MTQSNSKTDGWYATAAAVYRRTPDRWDAYFHRRPLTGNADRDLAIVRTYLTTDTSLTSVGRQFGVSAERVRQILNRYLRRVPLLYPRRGMPAA